MTSPPAPPKPENTAATSDAPAQRAAGKGLPDKEPQAQRSMPGQHATPKDWSVETSLEMPHERDQAKDMTRARPDLKIQQAGRDLKAGRRDTSKGAEMDSTYRKL